MNALRLLRLIAVSLENSAENVVKFGERHLIGDRDQADDIGLTCRRTARRIKRLKGTVLTISPDYSDRPTPDFLALSGRGALDGRGGKQFALGFVVKGDPLRTPRMGSLRQGALSDHSAGSPPTGY